MKKDPAILHLNLHREFFASIAAGTKTTEYRTRTPYWRTRLEGRRYDHIKFRNGCATRAPEMLVEFAGLRRQGHGAKAVYAKMPTSKTNNAMEGPCFYPRTANSGSSGKSRFLSGAGRFGG